MERKKRLEHTRKVQEDIVQFLAFHWHRVVLVGFVLLIVFTFVPIPIIEHTKKPSQNWQNLGYWATYFYALSAFTTLVVVLGAAILAMRQLTYMDRTQKIQVVLRLFDEFKEIEKLDSSRKLYENFCENGRFNMDLSGMSDNERKAITKDITYILHTYSQIGAIVRGNIPEETFVVPLLAGVCVRMWIVLEDHIQKERGRRKYPILHVTFEYLVILCLIYILEHEPHQLAIYHPDAPDDPKTSRVYSSKELHDKLQELQAEVKKIELNSPESRIDIPINN